MIGAEHPHLHATHIDTDEHTQAEQLAIQLVSGSAEDETAWRDGEWFAFESLENPPYRKLVHAISRVAQRVE